MFRRFTMPSRPGRSCDQWRGARLPKWRCASSGATDEDDQLRRWLDLKTRLHERLLEELNLSAIEKVGKADLRREVATIVNEMLTSEATALNAKEFNLLIEELLDEVLGLGPLEPLLKDPTVTDILVNTHKQVFVEQYGILETTPVQFKDERHLLRIIDRIVSAVGRRVDESQPWVDARLADGSRDQRDHSALRVGRPAALDPQVLARPADHRAPDRQRRADPRDGDPAQRDHQGASQPADLGRHRQRQDHAARTRSPATSRPASGSSRSRIRPSSSCNRPMSRGWRPDRPTSRGAGR